MAATQAFVIAAPATAEILPTQGQVSAAPAWTVRCSPVWIYGKRSIGAAVGASVAGVALKQVAGRRSRRGAAARNAVVHSQRLEVVGTPVFDPLGLAKDAVGVRQSRYMEIVMGRFAMLAVVGLPMAEMHHATLARLMNAPDLLADGNRAPSIINGSSMGMFPEALTFVAIAVFAMTVDQALKGDDEDSLVALGGLSQPTLSPLVASLLQQAEIHNGRFAMIGLVMISVLEAVTQQGVVQLTPELFGLPRAA